MSPGDPALAMPLPAPGQDAVPDYVQSLERAANYLPEAQRLQLRRAWAVGAAAHAGQTRKSGEPYITHPVAVAQVLAEQGLDVETLVAAILHDTIEDTPLSRQDLATQFGETVAELVDGVTKLDKLRFADRQEAAAESFRKMLLAMSRDLRVILIKLADRLHNMRTLGAQSAEARRRIAVETLEIFAPIAQRLGMNLIKSELQDMLARRGDDRLDGLHGRCQGEGLVCAPTVAGPDAAVSSSRLSPMASRPASLKKVASSS